MVAPGVARGTGAEPGPLCGRESEGPTARNCEIDKGVNCLDGCVASEHMTPMVARQLVRVGSTADGIPRAGHAPVALQIKTALAGRLRVSVQSLPPQQQKDMVQRIALTLSDKTLSASQTAEELSSIAEALATEKEGQPGRQETNPLATPHHRRHPGEDARSKLIKNLGRYPEQRQGNAPRSEIRDG